MLRSDNRIVTSHAGALEQPEALRPTVKARDEGQAYDEAAFVEQLRGAVSDVVETQFGIEVGLQSPVLFARGLTGTTPDANAGFNFNTTNPLSNIVNTGQRSVSSRPIGRYRSGSRSRSLAHR